MLNVGIDSYTDLEDAEMIAQNSFMSTDDVYKAWLELSESDKEVLLKNSCRDIDALKFDGRRKSLSQTLEFPRVINVASGIAYRLYIGQFFDNGLYSYGNTDGGVSAVKKAQVINAVYAGYYNDLTNDTIGLNIQGLTSKKAGPIAESYNTNNKNSKDALIGIYTQKVYSILRPWLNDSRISY